MRMVRNGVTVDFTYINGIPATISFNGNTFYYIVNGQGDVTGITDSQGNLQLSYYYDAWGTPYYIYATGNTYGSTLLTINPIMYRSYVFDRELGMYYLQSRYYIPQIGRFLNADGLVSTGQGVLGNNMFAYCGNNPLNRKDPNGEGWLTALIIAVVVVVVATVAVKSTANYVIDKSDANDAEKALAKKDYIAAYQVNEAKTITQEYIDKTYGRENDCDGTQVNAYRHAMWNAVMTDKIGEEKAKKFADAHEQTPDNEVELMAMDLHNNELGRRIALEYAGQGYDVFSEKIQEAINNGEAYVIKWDPNVD